MSKGGLYAHFGSKEELQLATIETAGAIFEEEVVSKGLAAPPGPERVLALADAFLEHLRRPVCRGGCFFASAAAEFDTRPGRVMQDIASFPIGWLRMIRQLVAGAQALGELSRDTDPDQLAFELNAMLVGANSAYLLQGDAVLDRAHRGIERLLERS